MPAATTDADSPATMAQVLAMVLAVHSSGDPRELRMLEELDAFRRIGVSEAQFKRIVRSYREGACRTLSEHGYPYPSDLQFIDEILDGVHDAQHRLLLCRLAGCLITRDGRIDDLERTVYDRMLLRWGHTRASVSRAILTQHVH